MQNAGLMLLEASYLSLFMFGISTFRQKNGMPFIAAPSSDAIVPQRRSPCPVSVTQYARLTRRTAAEFVRLSDQKRLVTDFSSTTTSGTHSVKTYSGAITN